MNVQEQGKKHKKRIITKYSMWLEDNMIKSSYLGKRCYNHNCKNYFYANECKHAKCRFKNNRFKPSKANNYWKGKR